jgi:cytochrome c5
MDHRGFIRALVSVLGGLALLSLGAAEAAEAPTGEQVYRKICSYCHDDGQLGAPRTDDRTAWKPRLAKGRPALYRSALEGTDHMPSRMSRQGFGEADVKAAVDYLIGKVE